MLDEIISRMDGDYGDIRYESLVRTRIEIKGTEVREVSKGVCDGFVLRLLKGGGFASTAVTKASDLVEAMRDLESKAELMRSRGGEKVCLKVPPAALEDVSGPLQEDPRGVSLEEKISLLGYYNSIARAVKGIISTSAVYEEIIRDRHFINTAGSLIHEPLVTCSITVRITSEGEGTFRNGRAVVASSNGFRGLRSREDVFERKADVVARLLKAEALPSGTYNVVLNQEMTGVFIHEAFGHFSEADMILNNPSMREKMRIGSEIGSPVLSIWDDPTMPGQIGFYRYDDEGVCSRRVGLMEQGVLKGRLHSMKTAALFDEPLTGHAIAEDARYEPLVRMGCIHVAPGNCSREELFERAGDGLYVLDSKGGQTGGENFTFGAQYGFLIKDGHLGSMVRDMNLMGNLFETLRSVEAAANDLVISEAGGCGKGQMNVRSAMGGPHILIKGLKVGGS
jgi:TldD protein